MCVEVIVCNISVVSRVTIQSIESKWVSVQVTVPGPSVGLRACVHACVHVCESVSPVDCGKMADWIWMSFAVVGWLVQG